MRRGWRGLGSWGGARVGWDGRSVAGWDWDVYLFMAVLFILSFLFLYASQT